jgi:uncharacterized protein RhaS with RHS repeats
MQQRYYDPAIGRFLSVDPASTNPNTGASFSRYSYANDNPYRFVDPDGRKCVEAKSGYSCTVDSYVSKGKTISRSAMSAQELKSVARFEKSYSTAVTKLMSNPKKTTTISMPGSGSTPGKAVTTTAGSVGQALIARNIEANSPEADAMATSSDTTYVGARGLTGAKENSLEGIDVSSREAARQVEIVHEGLHGDGTNVTDVLRGTMDMDPWNKAHQSSFNQAASDLLGL